MKVTNQMECNCNECKKAKPEVKPKEANQKLQVFTITLALKNGQPRYQHMEGKDRTYNALLHFFKDINYNVEDIALEVKRRAQ